MLRLKAILRIQAENIPALYRCLWKVQVNYILAFYVARIRLIVIIKGSRIEYECIIIFEQLLVEMFLK